MNAAMCNCCFGVIINNIVISLVLMTKSKVCTPDIFESHKIYDEFADEYFSATNEKLKYSFCDSFLGCLWIQHMAENLVSDYEI